MERDTTDTITFPMTYQESLAQFQAIFPLIQRSWPEAVQDSESVSEVEDLRVSWIHGPARRVPKRILILTAGIHGVEGFVGAAMRTLFLNEFLDQLDPDQTGILLVHCINPWGMENQRRVNANNVDLNRNFMEGESEFQEDFNPDYLRFDAVLNPQRPLRPTWLETPGLLVQVLVNLARFGIKGLRGAVLLGQQAKPAGLYFTGRAYQPETLVLMRLIRKAFQGYPDVLQVDFHTGYGPRYQMSVVNSPAEKRRPPELREAFHYPLITQADPEGFYSMKGDMIDWVYRLKRSSFPQSKYYGTAFEFGVYGDGISNEIRSLRTMIAENQVYHHGALTTRLEAKTRQELREMYFPPEREWRQKACADCRQALRGILKSEGYLSR